MSELIENFTKNRRDLLKHLILQLHKGIAPDEVRKQLVRLLGDIPYDEVVKVEQELISEGLPAEEVIKMCDVHSEALKGSIDKTDAKTPPAGHPVHTFQEENNAIRIVIGTLNELYNNVIEMDDEDEATKVLLEIRSKFNDLQDVEKHYQRKENLVFPYLEKKGITGPPTVMWGKHDEVREKMNAVHESFSATDSSLKAVELKSLVEILFKPTSDAIDEMVFKETEIFLPMCMDSITDEEWLAIYEQTPQYGYCLYDPQVKWKPEGFEAKEISEFSNGRIQLESGSFTMSELSAILNHLPVDMTFVDKDDVVRFFTMGKERIFHRSRAILGRKVQMCHPPSSVHIVQQILDDFKIGRQDNAAFWINLHGKFIHIEYFALRDEDGEYAGTLEVSEDLTEKRALEGEQRLLKYADGK